MKTRVARFFRMAPIVAGLAVVVAELPVAAQEPAPADTSLASDNGQNSSALPAGVDPDSPLAHVIRLAQADISEGVILAYVTNSPSPFNLTADQIIYLRDIGLSDEVITAVLQHDQTLSAESTPPPSTAVETAAAETAPVTTVETVTAPPAEITVDYFYDALAPYGTWVVVPGYGRCWRPLVAVYSPGWQPYCQHGHWVYTDCGWYWVSDYSWGWCTFHYGRWFRDPRWGWCWHPDTVWGPSWVTWRYSGDYCGWAPLPPAATWTAGVGWSYRGAAVSASFDFDLTPDCFTFVPASHFCDARPWHYRVEAREAARIYHQTTVINDFSVHRTVVVNDGIPVQHIEEITRRPVPTFELRDTERRMARAEQFGPDGRTLFIHRPRVNGSPAFTLPARPPQPGAAFQGQPPQRNFHPLPPAGRVAGNENRSFQSNPPASGGVQVGDNVPRRFPPFQETPPPVAAPAPTPPRLGQAINQPSPPPANRPLPGTAFQGPPPQRNFNLPGPAAPPPVRSPNEVERNPVSRSERPEMSIPAMPTLPPAANRRPFPFERMDPPPALPTRNFQAPRQQTPPVPVQPRRFVPPAMSAPRVASPPAPASPPPQPQRSAPRNDPDQNNR